MFAFFCGKVLQLGDFQNCCVLVSCVLETLSPWNFNVIFFALGKLLFVSCTLNRTSTVMAPPSHNLSNLGEGLKKKVWFLIFMLK